MTVLYTDIRELVTNDPANGDGDPLGIITDAALVVDGAEIAWIGRRADAPDADERISCADTSVIPGFVDSHTHLVFAGERSAEFAARMSGQPYGAGGIASTVAATRAADDATLLAGVQRLADELLRAGVTTFECKSGYGLTVEDEARSLRIAKAVTDETTFLGAHVVPAEFRDDREAYIEMVSGPMLQACAPHARWVDVFCDRGAFDVDEARHILTAGMAAGLDARLHAGQLGPSAGIRLAVELGAASVDHCTYATDDDVEALAGAADTTVATLLPGAEFSTRARYPDAQTAHRRGRDRRAGDRLQSGQFVHDKHAVLHRGRGAGHEFHSGPGVMGHDRRRGGGTAPRRRRGPHRRAAGGFRSAGRPVVRAPRVPARCAAGS